MESLLRSLTQHTAELLAVSLLILGLLTIAVLFIFLHFRRTQQRWSSLLRGVKGDNLEVLLYQHLREKMRFDEEFRMAKDRIAELEARMTTSKRHFGLVRYDAFEDVGGSQSFALAIYDDNGNGTVLSGIVGRTDARVYCKPLVNGRSERILSQEEERAIREARSEAPKSIVSP